MLKFLKIAIGSINTGSSILMHCFSFITSFILRGLISFEIFPSPAKSDVVFTIRFTVKIWGKFIIKQKSILTRHYLKCLHFCIELHAVTLIQQCETLLKICS